VSVAGARLILASGSPQRRSILTQIGVVFEVRVSGVEELAQGPGVEVAMENAHRKAAAVAGGEAGELIAGLPVLGVDTVVSLGTRLLGKPGDEAEAAEMLTLLAGRRHLVISGVCLIDRDLERVRTAAARTVVEFRELSAAAVARYASLGEWEGRAGAYAIQERGATLVRAIEGDYLNVVGLPVATLIDLFPSLLD
jgi:septum formation protein